MNFGLLNSTFLFYWTLSAQQSNRAQSPGSIINDRLILRKVERVKDLEINKKTEMVEKIIWQK